MIYPLEIGWFDIHRKPLHTFFPLTCDLKNKLKPETSEEYGFQNLISKSEEAKSIDIVLACVYSKKLFEVATSS
jgi:hypothetical protein